MDKNTTQTHRSTDTADTGKALWKSVIGFMPFPLATAIGYYAFDNEVRKDVYTNVAKSGVFNKNQEIRNNAVQSLVRQGSKDGKSIGSELHVIQEDYRLKVAKYFKEHLGMKGMSDYWVALERNQKISALVLGATVFSIVIGASFLIKDNDKLQEAFARLDKQDREKESQRS